MVVVLREGRAVQVVVEALVASVALMVVGAEVTVDGGSVGKGQDRHFAAANLSHWRRTKKPSALPAPTEWNRPPKKVLMRPGNPSGRMSSPSTGPAKRRRGALASFGQPQYYSNTITMLLGDRCGYNTKIVFTLT